MLPLLVVAGYLGAGKTTFLRALLQRLGDVGLRSELLLNDLQNAEVDAATLSGTGRAQLVPINGACLCCETDEALLAALADPALVDRADLVIVELNGTSDTGAVLEQVVGSPALTHLAFPLQLTVVDLQRFGLRGWQSAIERDQIQTASHLAFSRQDVVAPERADEVVQQARALAPGAQTTTAEALAKELASLAAARAPASLRQHTPHAHHHTEHADHHRFAAFSLPLPGRFDPVRFESFLSALPPQVVRAKGIVELTEPPGERRSFQVVAGAAEISPCQLEDPDGLSPVAVFIGTDAPVATLRAQLEQLLPHPAAP